MAEVGVVGGGPAGLAAAIACRRQGFEVHCWDRGEPPRDKACGEGLMPAAVAALERLGVDLGPLGRPFVGIRYFDGRYRAEGRFPRGTGVGVRRTVLHRALAECALREGVVLHWGERVEGIDPRPDEVEVQSAQATRRVDWLVGADGLRSRVRCWAELDGSSARRRRFGVRRHYQMAAWSDFVEVSWSRRGEAYVTPVAEDLVGVAMLWSGGKASFEELLMDFPDLRSRLEGVPISTRDRGAGPFEQRVRAVARGRVLLVGDASGYLDAITGEGVGLALRQAEALANTLAAGDPGAYVRSHRRIGRRIRWVTQGLLGVERVPAVRRSLVGLLAGAPGLFSTVLGWMAR